jgi:DNA-binding GntR family transcriptional regulator
LEQKLKSNYEQAVIMNHTMRNKYVNTRHIYSTIKERILFLEYPPGTILNEKALTEEFEVSRTPLREVLNRLEWEQLIRILPRTGSLVTELEFEKIINAYQIRLDVEALSYRFAAENISDQHVRDILKLEEELQQLMDRKSLKEIGQIDFRLRDILYGAADNQLLRDISDYLYNVSIRVWYLIYERGDWREETAAYLNEIKLTKDVLSKKDPIKASETRKNCLADHVERIRSKFLSWS